MAEDIRKTIDESIDIVENAASTVRKRPGSSRVAGRPRETVSSTRIDRKAYLFAPDAPVPPQGTVRSLARTGDMLERADGTWWLVTVLIEDFTASGWVCVGIAQQVDGPDLGAPDANGEDTHTAHT